MNMLAEFSDAMRSNGLEARDHILPDGLLHRYKVNGDRSGSKNGWYTLHIDGIPAGAFGSWKTGESHTWCSKKQDELSSQERAEYRQRIDQAKKDREAEQAKLHVEAAEKCRDLWDIASKRINHQYIVDKGIKPYGLRQLKSSLFVPLYFGGELVNLQFISDDGTKRFKTGGRVTGCYRPIGKVDDVVYIVEGYATGASVFEATSKAVCVAFNAGNLKPVAQMLREKYPDVRLVVCADNDEWTEGNPGITKAQEAASFVGASFVAPQFDDTSTRPTDFNDLHKLEGLGVVRQQLEVAQPIKPETKERDESACEVSLFDDEGKKKSQATILIELTDKLVNLFHDKERRGYAVFVVNTHKECWPVRAKGFKDWLKHQFFRLTGRGTSNQGLQDAIDTIEAKALFNNPEYQVYRRIANLGNKIIFDLGDKDWRAVEVTAASWRVEQTHSIHFIRTNSMLSLPNPEAGGDINDFRKFINIENSDFPLIIGWLLMAMRGRGPYPVLLLQGEQGTGKSTTTRNIRSLVDPVTVPIKAPPKDEHDLAVVAHNNAIVALDNLSGVTKLMSDTLCRIATGGGIGSRKLYTNLEEEAVDIIRPVILNGIDDIATRGDLLERSLIVELPTINEKNRSYELDMDSNFESAKPKLFGALLDVLSIAIQNEPTTVLSHRPRMADFARWVTSAETGLGWEPGLFLESYRRNINQAIESTLEASPIGMALRSMMELCHS